MQLRRTLIGVLALLGALAMPGVAAADPGITPVGTLERFPQEAIDALGPEITGTPFTTHTGGTLLPVFGAGQLWQLYPDPVRNRTGILVRDANSHKLIGSQWIGHSLRRGALDAAGGGEWLHATDGGRRVFVVTQAQQLLLEIDALTLEVRSHGQLTVLPTDVPFNVPMAAGGLSYDAATGDLLVLYGGPAAFSLANRLTVLQRIDLGTGERQQRIVRACTGPLPATDVGSTYAAELLLRGDAVTVTCQTRLRGFFGSPPLDDDTRALVVRLPRTSLWDADGDESSVEAGRWFNAALVDPGSGRIAVLDLAGRVTVVDVGSMAAVGTFETTLGGRVGIGLDTTSGRFFFQSDRGFGYVDIRSNPLPAPVLDAAAASEGQERIVPDGNRTYVLPGTTFPDNRPDRYTIYNVSP